MHATRISKCFLFAVATQLADGAQTFGVSLKGQGFYVGHEATIFSRPCSAAEAPCAMQHFWSGGFIPEYGSSLLRYYVDGEQDASVVIPLGLGHGQATLMDDNAPWAAGSLMGKTGVGYAGWGSQDDQEGKYSAPVGTNGELGQAFSGAGGSGLFNAYLVPFQHNVSVSLEFTGSDVGHLVIFWVVLRGRTKAVLLLPGTPSVTLPPTARLRSFYVPETPLQPLEVQRVAREVYQGAMRLPASLGKRPMGSVREEEGGIDTHTMFGCMPPCTPCVYNFADLLRSYCRCTIPLPPTAPSYW